MDNISAFNKSKEELLSRFQHPESTETGQERKDAYTKCQNPSTEVFKMNWYEDVKIKLLGAVALVVLPIINVLLTHFNLRTVFVFPLVIIAIAGGWMTESLGIGLILLGAAAVLNTFAEKAAGLFAVLCLIGAGVLAYMLYKEYRIQKNAYSYRIGSNSSKLKDDFYASDRNFKYELIRSLADLCEKHSATKKEYDTAMDELLEEFERPHPYEISDHLYRNRDKMEKYIEDEYRRIFHRAAENEARQAKRETEISQPFLMYVDYTFYQEGDGLRVTGTIRRGTVKVGDKVDSISFGQDLFNQVVARIRKYKKNVEQAFAGDKVDLVFENLKPDDIVRGQAIAATGTVGNYREFDAYVSMADRIQPVASGSEVYFYFDRGPYVKGTMTSAEGVSEFTALYVYKVHIRLEKPIALEKKTGFSFKDEHWDLGNGTMI